MSAPPTPSPFLRPRTSVEVRDRGFTPQHVKALQNNGQLSRIRLSGTRTVVDIVELDAYVAARTDPPVYGPLAGQGDSLDALIRRATEDRDPEAQSALIAIGQRVDSALWGDL